MGGLERTLIDAIDNRCACAQYVILERKGIQCGAVGRIDCCNTKGHPIHPRNSAEHLDMERSRVERCNLERRISSIDDPSGCCPIPQKYPRPHGNRRIKDLLECREPVG